MELHTSDCEDFRSWKMLSSDILKKGEGEEEEEGEGEGGEGEGEGEGCR